MSWIYGSDYPGGRKCTEFALRPHVQHPDANHPDPMHRPVCCAAPPYDMMCLCDQSCTAPEGVHRCKACGYAWRIVGHYVGEGKKKRWNAWIEPVGPIPLVKVTP